MRGIKRKQSFGLILFMLVVTCFLWIGISIQSVGRVDNGAFVTFLSDDIYLVGARVLHQSIKDTNTKYPMVVLVTDGVSMDSISILKSDGCIVKKIDVVPNPKSDEIRYKWVYTKLRAWELTEYDRVVFLDADIVVLDNIDELFDNSLSKFAVVSDCCDYFNAGVMSLVPSKWEFDDMISKIAFVPSYDNGDQGFLNEYYKDTWYKLPYGYNAQQPDYVSNPKQWNLDSIKVIHYEQLKPWKGKNDELWEIHKYWWNVYDKLILK